MDMIKLICPSCAALNYCEATTGRNRIGANDDITGSWECGWQDRATAEGYGHISVFCSMGEWATNLSDLLTDDRFDHCSFHVQGQRETLFRH